MCTHIDFGGLGESSHRVNVIIENDDAHHHPHAEQHGVCVGEPAAVLPGTDTSMEEKSDNQRDKKCLKLPPGTKLLALFEALCDCLIKLSVTFYSHREIS